jgi:rod shape determining protein RodA
MILISSLLFFIGLFSNFFRDSNTILSQILLLFIGFLAYFTLKRVKFTTYQSLWKVLYTLGIIFLCIPFFFPEIRGSHRWILLFGITIQPSELFKPFYILSIASYIADIKKYTLKDFTLYCFYGLLPILLVAKQPDLGSALVYVSVFIGIFFVSPFSLKYLFVLLTLFVTFLPILWKALADYQKQRIFSFIDPTADIKGTGYNAFQALVTTGSGGTLGKGLSSSTLSELQFLPEYHTDFIFASTVERIGLVGGLLILICFGILLFLIYKKTITDYLAYSYFAFGVLFMFLSHIVIHIGMNIGIMPVTGITLPFLSLGGSSLLSFYISLGILNSFAKNKIPKIALH